MRSTRPLVTGGIGSPLKSRLGLRGRAIVAFAAGGLLVSAVLAASTYAFSRSYLLSQREASGLRQAFADASFVRDRLLTAGNNPGEVIGDIAPSAGARVLVRASGQWYSSDLNEVRTVLPPHLVNEVRGGKAALSWQRQRGMPVIVVGTPLPAVDAEFYEVSPATELQRTLQVLRRVLIIAGLVTAAAAAVFGRSVARRVVRPLDAIAGAASSIAAGRLDTRLDPTDDPDLLAIVASFNSMVDGLSARIDREARFTADVAHELRSPLTTMVTGVELLSGRAQELSPRGREALALVRGELDRLRRTVEDLLELARLDADPERTAPGRTPTDLNELVIETLKASGRDPALVRLSPAVEQGLAVLADRRQVDRALRNLLDNADRHGKGALLQKS